MMMVGGHPQPSSANSVCYACGIDGHKRGDLFVMQNPMICGKVLQNPGNHVRGR